MELLLTSEVFELGWYTKFWLSGYFWIFPTVIFCIFLFLGFLGGEEAFAPASIFGGTLCCILLLVTVTKMSDIQTSKETKEVKVLNVTKIELSGKTIIILDDQNNTHLEYTDAKSYLEINEETIFLKTTINRASGDPKVEYTTK